MTSSNRAFWAEFFPINPATGLPVRIRICTLNTPEATGIDLGNGEWMPYMSSFPDTEINVFSGTFDGTSEVSIGNIEAADINGFASAFSSYVWDGATVIVYKGDQFSTLLANLTPIFNGSCTETPKNEEGEVSWDLKDKSYLMDVEILKSTYAGTGGIEGTAEMQGVSKPFALGSVLNAEPVLVDPAYLIYQYHGYGVAQGCAGTYENGLSFGAGQTPVAFNTNEATTFAALRAASLDPGEWVDCPSLGMFRLGAEPLSGGVITCDVNGYATGGFKHNIDDAFAALVVLSGLHTTLVDGSTYTGLYSGSGNQTVGDYFTGPINLYETLTKYLAQAGGYPFISSTGKLRFGFVRMGTPALEIRSDGTSAPVAENAIQMPVSAPYKRLRMAGDKVFRVHDNGEISDALYQSVNGLQTALDALTTDYYLAVNDDNLTIQEKIQIAIPTNDKYVFEYTSLRARAVSLGLSVTALDTAYNNYVSDRDAISPAWNNTAVNSLSIPATFRARVATLGDALTTIATSISVEDAKLANWPAITGAGKPANNAGTTLNLYDFTAGRHLIYGNEVEKIGAGGWTSNVYSRESFTGSFTISGRMDPAQGAMMFGVTDTAAAGNYDQLDYAFYGTGSVSQIYESGSYVTAFGGYAATTLFTIDYDGVWLRYLIDGNEVAKRAVGPNRKFWAGVSIFNSGAKMPGITFGPYNDAANSPVMVNPLKLIGSNSQIVGNSIRKIAGTHGAVEGAAVGTKQTGTAFVSARPIQGNTWTTLIGLDPVSEGNLNTSATGVWLAQFVPSSSGGGSLTIFKNGLGVDGWGIPNYSVTDRFSLEFNGRRVFAMLNGNVYGGNASAYDVAPGTAFWPKVFDFYLTGQQGPGTPITEGIVDIRYGPWNDVRTYLDDGYSVLNQAGFKTDEGIADGIENQGPGATAPGNEVLNYRDIAGSAQSMVAYPEGGAFVINSSVTGHIRITLPVAATYTMVQFEVDVYNYVTGTSGKYRISGYIYDGAGEEGWINCSAQYVGAEDRSMPVTFGFQGGFPCVRIGSPATVWEFPSVLVSNFVASYSGATVNNWKSGWAVTVTTSYLSSEALQILKPRAGDAVFGEGVKEVAGGALATLPNFKTILGIADGIDGQGAGATANNLNDLDPTAAGTLAGLVANGAITVGEFETIKKSLAPGAAVVLNGRYGVDQGGGSGTLQAQIQSSPAGSGSWSSVATSSTTPVGPSEPGSRTVSGTFTNGTGQSQVFEFRIAGIRSPGGSGGATFEHQTFLTG